MVVDTSALIAILFDEPEKAQEIAPHRSVHPDQIPIDEFGHADLIGSWNRMIARPIGRDDAARGRAHQSILPRREDA